MTLTATRDDLGHMVRYWKNGWRFAKLVKLGRKWAKVLHPVSGHHRIAAHEIESFAAWALANPSGQDVKHGGKYATQVTHAIHQRKPRHVRSVHPAGLPQSCAQRYRAPHVDSQR